MPTAAERLNLLCDLTRRLATLNDLGELLGYATRRTREIFQAEGCALLVLDHHRHEFYFPVTSQAEARQSTAARLAEVRFPADQGIAGWVLSHGESVLVDDVTRDQRFYPGVDQVTEMKTRSLLCAPLRTEWGNVGVIEVVNPPPGSVTTEDLRFLEVLASDIAVAHEKVLLNERLRSEVVSLRQAFMFVGAGVALVGVVLGAGAMIGHLAWALPLSELPTRPGVLFGVFCLLAGGTLLAVGRGRMVARTPAPRL